MAVSGSVTAAYKCRVSEYRLEASPTSTLSGECATMEAALARLQAGETVTVAASSMMQLRQRLAGLGVA